LKGAFWILDRQDVLEGWWTT